MHQSINQPPFWLSVRKEYVVDNFESLLDYLRNYQYIEENEAPDGDFNRTYKCLGEVADDYLAQMADDNLVQTSQDNTDGSQGFPLKVREEVHRRFPPVRSLCRPATPLGMESRCQPWQGTRHHLRLSTAAPCQEPGLHVERPEGERRCLLQQFPISPMQNHVRASCRFRAPRLLRRRWSCCPSV